MKDINWNNTIRCPLCGESMQLTRINEKDNLYQHNQDLPKNNNCVLAIMEMFAK